MKRRDFLRSTGMAVPAGMVGLWAAERFPEAIYGPVDLGPAANSIDPELCLERLLDQKMLEMSAALERAVADECFAGYGGIDASPKSWWKNRYANP